MHPASTRGRARLGLLWAALSALLVGPSAPRAGSQGAAPHQELSCSRCHTWQESAPTASVCKECHEPRVSELGVHADRTRSCTGCHSPHDPTQLIAKNDRFTVDFDDEDLLGHCTACHGGGEDLADLSPGHWAATAVYHSNEVRLGSLSPSDACLVCHARGAVVPSPSGGFLPAPEFHTGASHPFGVPVQRDRLSVMKIRHELDPRLPLFNGVIECQTCHSLRAGTDDLLIPFETKYDLCLGCHQRGSRNEALARVALGSP